MLKNIKRLMLIAVVVSGSFFMGDIEAAAGGGIKLTGFFVEPSVTREPVIGRPAFYMPVSQATTLFDLKNEIARRVGVGVDDIQVDAITCFGKQVMVSTMPDYKQLFSFVPPFRPFYLVGWTLLKSEQEEKVPHVYSVGRALEEEEEEGEEEEKVPLVYESLSGQYMPSFSTSYAVDRTMLDTEEEVPLLYEDLSDEHRSLP